MWLGRIEIYLSAPEEHDAAPTEADIQRQTILAVLVAEATEASNSMTQGAIIDRNARIGENSMIVNTQHKENADGGNYYIRDGIVIIPEDTIIPPNTTI